MTLFEDTNAPYSDSNTTTLTEQQPATEVQSEQPEPSAHHQQDHVLQENVEQDPIQQDHEQQDHGEQSAQPNEAQQSQAQPGDEKPAPAAAEDFASVLDSFTAEAAEAASEDHVI